MGEHHHNPTAIAAKNGELPPKSPRKSKKEMERELKTLVMTAIMKKVPATAAIMTMCGAKMDLEEVETDV